MPPFDSLVGRWQPLLLLHYLFWDQSRSPGYILIGGKRPSGSKRPCPEVTPRRRGCKETGQPGSAHHAEFTRMGYIQKGDCAPRTPEEALKLPSPITSSWCIVLSSQVWKGQANNSHMVRLLEVPGLTTALDRPATGRGVQGLVVGKNVCVFVSPEFVC